MSFFKHAVGVVVAVCVCLLAGCGGVTSARRGKQSGKKVVVTTFTIMADMVREVAGEAAEVESLIRPGAEIQALDERMRERLAAIPEGQRWLVTSEGAFSYLCQSYGLRQLYLWPVNAEVQGTPQQVQAVIDGVRAHRIPVVFSESTVSDRPARQVAQEAGARYGGVLYVDSLTPADGPAPTFLKLLEYNADAIVRGLLGE